MLGLGTRIGGALAQIGIDRVAESLGGALPRTREQLATPEALNHLLQEFQPGDAGAAAGVRAARLPGVEFESSNCTNFLIEVEVEPGEPDPPLRTLYAKLPCPELGTRAFANAIGFWDVEVAFCERVAHLVPVRVPRVHAAAHRGSRFVLLLENLNEIPGVRLFLNRDMAAGSTLERAERCLASLAELHASFWHWDAPRRESLLPIALHPYLGRGGLERTRALNSAAIEPTRRAAPDLFLERHAEICRGAIEKWERLVDYWYSEPLTLIHGDSHLANCFEYPTEAGTGIGWLDFQGMQWCAGIRDVQYHLINSLDPELLVPREEELIGHYCRELAMHGVELGTDAAREQYRAFSFQTLMVAVVSLGLGSLTERTETVRTVLARSAAAIDRLGFGDWLAEL